MLTPTEAQALAALLVRADEAALAGQSSRVHDLLVQACDRVNQMTDYTERAEIVRDEGGGGVNESIFDLNEIAIENALERDNLSADLLRRDARAGARRIQGRAAPQLLGEAMTCDLCPSPATARDGDQLLCTDCWRAKHVVPNPALIGDPMKRPHPHWTTDDDATAAAYAGDNLDLLERGDDDMADYWAADDVPGRWVA